MSYVILALATWRIAHLMVLETGPFGVFKRLRERVGIVHAPDTDVIFIVPDNVFAQALSCVWCGSLLVGIGWGIFFGISPFWAGILALPFALSAGAILFHEVVSRS